MAASSGLSVEQALETLSQPVEDILTQSDDDLGGKASRINGSATTSERAADGTSQHGVETEATSGLDASPEKHSDDRMKQLLEELQRTRQERDGFQSQYKGLLGKLAQMRSTLGDRLRQDAEELDRREGQIETLTNDAQRMSREVEMIRSELVDSNADNERLTKEFDALRVSSQAAIESATRAAEEAAARTMSRHDEDEERSARESQLHQLTQSVESLKAQSAQWEAGCVEERTRREELSAALEQSRADQEGLRIELQQAKHTAQREQESARSLQAVLEEFQADQEAEISRALGDYQRKYDATAADLEEHKERSRRAEKRCSEYQEAAERATALEQDVKEKNLLIGKLRHEAVILNEHLTEALRRLNKDSTDTNVDRRLVTNILLQFLTTPRQDAKRFEMLNLLSTILQWSDEEKGTAGIQRSGSGADQSRRYLGIGASSPRSAPAGRSGQLGQEESFSNLFVEFLLSEAGQAQAGESPGTTSPTKAAIKSPQTAPSGRSSFESSTAAFASAEGRNHFGSSRRNGSVSRPAATPTRDQRSAHTRLSIHEEHSS
ncbi:unnamed protein product [Parajaminaea phylloscopi]